MSEHFAIRGKAPSWNIGDGPGGPWPLRLSAQQGSITRFDCETTPDKDAPQEVWDRYHRNEAFYRKTGIKKGVHIKFGSVEGYFKPHEAEVLAKAILGTLEPGTLPAGWNQEPE